MSRPRLALLGALLAAAAALAAALWLGRTAAGRLSPGRPVNAVLRPGHPQRWQVALAAGQHAAVEIRSQTAVSAHLVDPAGRAHHPWHEIDSGKWRAGWVAERPGRWRIEIEPPPAGAAVRYIVELVELRQASSQDRLAWRLDQLDDRWREALSAGGERAEAAPGLVARAAALREELHRGRPFDLAVSLTDLAFEGLDRDPCSPHPALQEQAERLLQRVVVLTAGDDGENPLWRAAALQRLSRLARDREAWEEAERYARQALEIHERLHGPAAPEVLDGLLPLAVVLVDLGRYGEAERLYDRALRIVGKPRPDSFLLLAKIYNVLGELDRVANRYEDAEEDFEKARSYGLEALPADDLFFALVANNLAGLFKDQGEYYRAERVLQEVLAPPRPWAGACPSDVVTEKLNLGEVYRLQGEYERAAPYYDEALAEAADALGEDNPGLAVFYNQRAALYADQGMLDEAAEYYAEALRRRRAAHGDHHPLVAQSLHDSADLEERRGRHAEAQRLYRQALSIREQFFGSDNPDVATTLTRLASSLFQDGRTAEALAAVERALRVFDRTEAYPEAEAEAYELRAEVHRRQGDRQAALADLGRSLEIVEEQRPRTGGGEQARTRFLSRYTDWFHRMIEWEVEAGRPDRGFEYAERSRARVLLDQLLAVRLDLLASIPDPARRQALASRRSAARTRLAGIERRIAVLQAGGPPRADRVAIAGRLSSLLIERDRADREVEATEEQVLNESPLWQMSARSEPVSLARVQSRLVPPDGLLLLYDVGPERSFLFTIPAAGWKAEVHALEVPPAAAAPLGVAPGALTRDKLQRCLLGPDGRGGLLQLLGEHPARNVGGAAAREEALAAGLHALWQTLIPAPIREQVKGASQVLVIPDGLLHRLPLEALVVERGARGLAGATFWLDAGPPVRYAASATSLAALMERARQEARDAAAAGPSILSVSDPVFTPPRAAPRGAAGEGPAKGLPKEEYERSGASLIRLPSTAAETRALLEAFSGAVLPLQRGQADERRVRTALPGKRYVHLATHGLVDERRSGLFAALALTPPARGVVTPDDDGFLQLSEIYRLKLDCRLAVLSACRTAFGSPQEGEGVFSLARGFHVAGARRVVASLWLVSDNATARLMGDYFRRIAEMEGRRRRQLPGYAGELFAAKQALGRPGPWRDPYYWAPFILSGEP